MKTINLWLLALVVFVFIQVAAYAGWFNLDAKWLAISGGVFCVLGLLAALGLWSGSISLHR